MNILFLGGDKRYKYMMEDLSEKHNVHQIGFKDVDTHIETYKIDLSKYDIVIFPMNGINDNLEVKSELGLIKLSHDIFENINKNTKFLTGLKTKKLLEFLPKEQIISFLDYKEVQKANNLLTVDRHY